MELLGELPEDVRIVAATRSTLDFIHFFTTSARDLERTLPGLKRSLAPDGALWVSWPKKTSSIENDVGEEMIRQAGLAIGLVDVKVCAVDEDWSGLKFVYRVKDREKLQGHRS